MPGLDEGWVPTGVRSTPQEDAEWDAFVPTLGKSTMGLVELRASSVLAASAASEPTTDTGPDSGRKRASVGEPAASYAWPIADVNGKRG